MTVEGERQLILQRFPVISSIAYADGCVVQVMQPA